MNTAEFRANCARLLTSVASNAVEFKAFVGLDGFVDEIVHAVDKRENAQRYSRLPTIEAFAQRIAGAAGKSTNIEMVNQRTKLGGNGPIMANALAALGLQTTYLGALGYPNLHPVFEPFSKCANVHSIADPGRTDAVEFLDGKVMLVKSVSLNDITWKNIDERFGRERFVDQLSSADLVAFVNWTMIPYMSDIWEELLNEACSNLKGPRRKIFFDLADPEKRPDEDIARALQLISDFEKYFDVILGVNEKESFEIADALAIPDHGHSPEALSEMGQAIYAKLRINTVVIHPVSYALAVSNGKVDLVQGPVITKPTITTGAGDHFNSGFCLGKLLGFDNAFSLLTGVSTSGYYVKTGYSPAIKDLARLDVPLAFQLGSASKGMILPVVKYGHPVLRQKGARIEKITPAIEKLIADMLDTMYDAKGVGLAAQQVGKALQLTVIDVREATERPSTLELHGQVADPASIMPLVLINPEWQAVNDPVEGAEGCLSFPEIYADILRPETVEVMATNEKSEPISFRCGGLLSRAIQHEYDHLHGVLFIDRVDKATLKKLKPELDGLVYSTRNDLKKMRRSR